MFYRDGKGEEILRGTAQFLQFRKQQLKKERQFKNGLFTIISESGLKNNYEYIKKSK